MSSVRFEKATRVYPRTTVPAIDSLELEVADGELVVLVGPSGSGKSTALRMLAGLEPVDIGAIYIGDRNVTRLTPKDRDIAMVFQNYALYPQMTVAENIGFPLKVKHVPKPEIRQRVVEAARLLDLAAFLDRKPAQLSGGQRQRVAMGRAIVRKPQVFLMDEPLSNLDAKLRVATRAQIASLQRRLEVTTVYVTHDQVEAMTMGDRVAVLREGVLQQCDTPRVLFDHPVNIFVAGFIGSPAMNLMVVPVDGEVAQLGPLTVPLTSGERRALSGGKVVLGVRPEGFVIVGPDAGIPAIVEVVEELGSDSFVHSTATIGGEPQVIVARTESKDAPARGAKIGLALRSDDTHKFDPDGGRSLEKLAD